MSILRNYTTNDFGRIVFIPALPSFVDPDTNKLFSVCYNCHKVYYFV